MYHTSLNKIKNIPNLKNVNFSPIEFTREKLKSYNKIPLPLLKFKSERNYSPLFSPSSLLILFTLSWSCFTYVESQFLFSQLWPRTASTGMGGAPVKPSKIGLIQTHLSHHSGFLKFIRVSRTHKNINGSAYTHKIQVNTKSWQCLFPSSYFSRFQHMV